MAEEEKKKSKPKSEEQKRKQKKRREARKQRKLDEEEQKDIEKTSKAPYLKGVDRDIERGKVVSVDKVVNGVITTITTTYESGDKSIRTKVGNIWV